MDTDAWVAAADRSDVASSAVSEARAQWSLEGGTRTTTDHVIGETLTTIRLSLGLDAAEAWCPRIDRSVRRRIGPIHEVRRDRAPQLCFRHQDERISFPDGCTFVLMRELQIRRLLTLDHDFRQMGFEVSP